jgi:hypothetical protein
MIRIVCFWSRRSKNTFWYWQWLQVFLQLFLNFKGCIAFVRVQWNLDFVFLSLCFYSLHIYISATKISIGTVLFRHGIYISAFFPILRLCFQPQHKLAFCCCFKYFQLEIRKEKLIFGYDFLSFTILWLQGCASGVESCFLLMPSLWGSEGL